MVYFQDLSAAGSARLGSARSFVRTLDGITARPSSLTAVCCTAAAHPLRSAYLCFCLCFPLARPSLAPESNRIESNRCCVSSCLTFLARDRLYHEPVSLPCGHTYCRGCLKRALANKSQVRLRNCVSARFAFLLNCRLFLRPLRPSAEAAERE